MPSSPLSKHRLCRHCCNQRDEWRWCCHYIYRSWHIEQWGRDIRCHSRYPVFWASVLSWREELCLRPDWWLCIPARRGSACDSSFFLPFHFYFFTLFTRLTVAQTAQRTAASGLLTSASECHHPILCSVSSGSSNTQLIMHSLYSPLPSTLLVVVVFVKHFFPFPLLDQQLKTVVFLLFC